MDEEDRKVIEDNLDTLITETPINAFQDLLNILNKKNVVNDWMKEKILSAESEEKRKKEFYMRMTKRGPEAYNELWRTLYDVGLTKLANLLKKKKNFLKERGDDELDSAMLESINVIKSTIRKDTDRRTIYKMGSHPKGYVLLINIRTFQNNIKEERTGSEKDEENLTKLWQGLGYEVMPETDLSSEMFKKRILKFRDMAEHKNVDSAVVFIMTHGNESKRNSDEVMLIPHSGEDISSEWVINQFTKDKCPNLEMKPKLFFFQACRGDSPEYRWKHDGAIHVTPNKADILAAYPCSPGKLSLRHEILGALFVQEICKVFQQMAHDSDIITMLDQVSSNVKNLTHDVYGNQVVNIDLRRFDKKLFFNPGLYDE